MGKPIKLFMVSTRVSYGRLKDYCTPNFLLSSFIEIRGKEKYDDYDDYIKWMLSGKDFLLDSGAYTFMVRLKNNKKFTLSNDKVKQYIDDYVNFINKWDIKHFFELDLDSFYPYETVKKIRRYIEKHTGKKCVPVWHRSRGIEEWHNLCQQYDYVAIGGMASKEINPIKEFNYLCELCDIAHAYGCKVHGLGYLSPKRLNDRTAPFDTCDGVGWQGFKWGAKFYVEDKQIKRKDDEDLLNKKYGTLESARINFKAWTEFSEILERGE